MNQLSICCNNCLIWNICKQLQKCTTYWYPAKYHHLKFHQNVSLSGIHKTFHIFVPKSTLDFIQNLLTTYSHITQDKIRFNINKITAVIYPGKPTLFLCKYINYSHKIALVAGVKFTQKSHQCDGNGILWNSQYNQSYQECLSHRWKGGSPFGWIPYSLSLSK